MRTLLLAAAAVMTLCMSGLTAASTGESAAAAEDLTLLKEEIGSLRNQLNTLQSDAATKEAAKGGAIYTRWGRTTCGSDAKSLYTGYAAGKKRDSSYMSASGEYICLHSTPEWGQVDSQCSGTASVAGIEYKFGPGLFSEANVGGQSLTYHEMPCTVCEVEKRSTQLMIPGRKSCPGGWKLEYWGYLVTGPYSFYGSPFICLDQAPEGLASTNADSHLQFIYAAEGDCLGLPCPPYVNGYEISCAVCSK